MTKPRRLLEGRSLDLPRKKNISRDIPDPDKELLEIDFGGGTKYTKDDKMMAVCLYTVTGNAAEVARMTGIERTSIQLWKTDSDWWPLATDWAKKKYQNKMEARMTGLLHKLMSTLDDRIDKGNQILDKDGNKVWVAAKLSELATLFGIVYDKRALMTGQATARTEKLSTDAQLEKIAAKFEEMQKLKVVSEQ